MKKKFQWFTRLVAILAIAITFSGGLITTSQIAFKNPLSSQTTVAKQKQKSKIKVAHSTKKAYKYRWAKPTAKVYINVPEDSDLYSASLDAIDAWNNTGAFTFKEVAKKKQARITINLSESSSTVAAGKTYVKFNPKTQRLISAQIDLNIYYLENPVYDYTYQQLVNTVEHELGHSIGLGHSKGVSVMRPEGSVYPIQKRDIKAVKKIYHKK